MKFYAKTCNCIEPQVEGEDFVLRFDWDARRAGPLVEQPVISVHLTDKQARLLLRTLLNSSPGQRILSSESLTRLAERLSEPGIYEEEE